MRCPKCDMTMERRKKQPYRYRESGLKNIVITVPARVCRNCGEIMPEIPNIKGLHSAIADCLFEKPAPLIGPEIRFLRKEMGMKAKDFASLVGVSAVTVSRWETGAEKIGHTADRLVRCLYLFHRIEMGREIRPARSFHRIQEEFSHIKRVSRPRPLSVTIPAFGS